MAAVIKVSTQLLGLMVVSGFFACQGFERSTAASVHEASNDLQQARVQRRRQPSKAEMELKRTVERGDLKGIERALAQGADVNNNIFGERPLYRAMVKWAAEKREAETARQYLKQMQPEMARRYRQELQTRAAREKVAELLLAKGADPNLRKTFNGQTVLHYLCRFFPESAEQIQWLVDHGADVNAQDDEGRTPLHLAVKHEDTAIAVLLLNATAKPNLKNKKGETPADSAILEFNSHLSQLLLERGGRLSASEPQIYKKRRMGKNEMKLYGFEFVELGGRPGHEGYFEKKGPLLKGATLKAKATWFGEPQRPRITVVDSKGKPIQTRVKMLFRRRYGGTLEIYYEVKLPNRPFRVLMTAQTLDGQKRRFAHRETFKPQGS